MRVAGSTLLYSRLGLEAACSRLADLGFDAVDIGMQEGWSHVDPSECVGAVDQVQRRVEGACTAADVDPVAINANAGDVDVETEAERVAAVADVADGLGVDVLTLPAAETDTALETDLERFGVLVDAVADRAVTLTVETHWGTLTEDPTVAAEYAATVPGLGYTLDPGHFVVGDHDVDPPYRDLLADTEHAHVRQAGTGWAEIQQPPERGDLDVGAFLVDLRESGYDGAVTVEYIDTLDGVDPETAERNAAEMRELVLERVS